MEYRYCYLQYGFKTKKQWEKDNPESLRKRQERFFAKVDKKQYMKERYREKKKKEKEKEKEKNEIVPQKNND